MAFRGVGYPRFLLKTIENAAKWVWNLAKYIGKLHDTNGFLFLVVRDAKCGQGSTADGVLRLQTILRHPAACTSCCAVAAFRGHNLLRNG